MHFVIVLTISFISIFPIMFYLFVIFGVVISSMSAQVPCPYKLSFKDGRFDECAQFQKLLVTVGLSCFLLYTYCTAALHGARNCNKT